MRCAFLLRPLTTLSVLAAVFAAVVGGCRQSDHQVAPVSGRVTLNQKPVAGVHVSFQPTGGVKLGSGSVGVTDEQGRFRLKQIDTDEEGAAVGLHIVRLTAKALYENGQSEAPPMIKNPLPPQSLDGSLKIEVLTEGTDQANFDLKN